MAGNGETGPRSPAAKAREDRLKAALKANMGRRKAQARARAATDADDQGPEKGKEQREAD